MENPFYKISSKMKYTMLIILIIMAERGFGQSDHNLSTESNFYSNRFLRNETYNKKIRLTKSRTSRKQSVVTIKKLIAPFVVVSPA